MLWMFYLHVVQFRLKPDKIPAGRSNPFTYDKISGTIYTLTKTEICVSLKNRNFRALLLPPFFVF